MLSKCANPKCNAQLRYLHEGRVFPICRKNTDIIFKPRIEYHWLCSTCCCHMTLTHEGKIKPLAKLAFRVTGGRDNPQRLRAYNAD